ncbi:MAG: class II D-tagatose-bisphosphate aldolase, non-catalytic subunit [Anaerolineales bacterium]|nr:class II D-tagatose-bisphosphate aldolase, non-catalytic subunit [Anaerolineales bacterium]
MYLDQIVQAQKQGKARGIASICSAHPWVLKTALRKNNPQRSQWESTTNQPGVLIEATCNQVNQYGGYTGMTPARFVRFVGEIAEQEGFPIENVILGGDHLGPHPWQSETADSAMEKSIVLVRDYVHAGFAKIHLDCSMRLADDPAGALALDVAAHRTAQLAKVAEESNRDEMTLCRYVIGTEVPVAGGAREHLGGSQVTKPEDVLETIRMMQETFAKAGLESAWERVVAVVVQPGVEFGDDFIQEYQPAKARHLSQFIESQSMVYEAHSTDYQAEEALRNLVRDHFAVLKVGPRLTFAFREAVFALAMMEKELFREGECSNLIPIVDYVMLQYPEHWKGYYHGSREEQALKRKYSFSDRIRYYWNEPPIQIAFNKLLRNLDKTRLPLSLLSQFAPRVYELVCGGEKPISARDLILYYIRQVLAEYHRACGG